MAIRRQVEEKIEFFTGQWSGPSRKRAPSGKCQLIYNMDVQDGLLRKFRAAQLYIDSAHGSGKIPYLDLYLRRWLYQVGKNLVFESSEGSAVEVLIAGDFDTDRIFGVEWRGRKYLANGKQLRQLEGNSLEELGLFPPGLGKTPRKVLPVVRNAIGSTHPAGTYKVAFTFYDSVRDVESLPYGSLVGNDGLFVETEYNSTTNPLGWTVTEFTESGTFSMTVGTVGDWAIFLEGRPARANKIRIYLDKDGAGFRRAKEIDAPITGPVTLDEAYADLAANLLIPEELIPPPRIDGWTNNGGTGNGPKFLFEWRDSLFYYGAVFNKNTQADSGTDFPASVVVPASANKLYAADSFQPEYIFNVFEIGEGDGEEPTGGKVFNDIPCVFKEDSSWSMIGTSITNLIAKKVDPNVGCSHASMLQTTKRGVLGLHQSGFFLFDGSSQASIISETIQKEIDTINFASLENASSCYDKKNHIYTAFLPTGTVDHPNRIFRYNVQEDAWSVGRVWEGGSCHSGSGSNRTQKTAIGSFYGGKIFTLEDEKAILSDGKNFLCRVRTLDFDFGTNLQKKLHWLHLTCLAHTDFKIDVHVYSDYQNGGVYSLTNILSNSSYATYASSQTDSDGAKYGTSRWGGKLKTKELKIPIEGVGRTFYIEIEEKTVNPERWGFAIQDLTVIASQLGK